jgi:transposase-like protein
MEITKRKKGQKYQSYSLEFKQLIVKEYFESHCSKLSIVEKYGINSATSLSLWIEKFGKKDESNIFTKKNYEQMNKGYKPEKKPDKIKQKSLEQENQELKLLVEYYKKVIETAEKQMKIVIEKKLDTK